MIRERTKSVSLKQNFPNPFGSSTNIAYELVSPGRVSLCVYDLSGRKIKTLVNQYMPAGEHTVEWDARHICNGMYFCEIKLNDEPGEMMKMMLVK